MLFIVHHNFTDLFDQEEGREPQRENRFGCVLQWSSRFKKCWQNTAWRYIYFRVMGFVWHNLTICRVSHACCIFIGEVLSELISSVEESGAKYAVLYVSDISRSIQYPSYRDLQRFLAESTTGNGSTNSTACDGVCQLKSSLLEGLLVVSFFAHFY